MQVRSNAASRWRAVAAAICAGMMLSGCGSEPADEPPAVSVEDQIDAQLAELAEYYGIEDPPPVDIVRVVTPEEFDTLAEDCLEAQGFISDAGLYSMPEAQKPTFELAQYTCSAQYPINPRYLQEWGTRQLEVQYVYTTDRLIPCLEERGYLISSVPSEEVFIENWASDPFYPFAQVPTTLSNAERRQLEQDCPQIAPSNELYAATD